MGDNPGSTVACDYLSYTIHSCSDRLFEIYTDLIKSNQPSATRARNWPELITKHLIIGI